MIYHIVIEGHNEEQMRAFFEEIQNKFRIFDNCVFEECKDEETIIDKDRYEETGNIIINPKIPKKYGD